MYIDSARKMDYERGHRSKYELDCLSICKSHFFSYSAMIKRYNKSSFIKLQYIQNNYHMITSDNKNNSVINLCFNTSSI